jgi:signal transduction histidine kinase
MDRSCSLGKIILKSGVFVMDRLFQIRKEEIRYNVLLEMEKFLGVVVKYALIVVILIILGVTRPDPWADPFFHIYFGISIIGALIYTYLLHSLLMPKHRLKAMILSSCLEILSVSLIASMLTENQWFNIAFLLLLLPIFRMLMLYPTVLEYSLTSGSCIVIFVTIIANLSPNQLLLPSFWIYFALTLLVSGLGIGIALRLDFQLNQSVKNHQLILQALQMVTSLIEMAESTAHVREKNKIFQKSVEIISRVMAVDNCIAWVYQDDKLIPAAYKGLEEKQISRFKNMEISIKDIRVFQHSLTQKVPIVITNRDDNLIHAVPLNYRRCFDVQAMLVIPVADNKRALGCLALHWRSAPKKITSQELAILSGIATQIGITLENVYLLEELREKEEIRGRLLERVISIQEAERERIARELHDETGQILTALMVNVELLKTEPGLQSAKFQDRLEEISSLLSKNMKDIHDLSLDLHPKILNELGLVSAIRSYVKNHLERWGINFNITASNLDHTLSDKEEICLFRVTQEAITNVIRHSQAQRVDIEIGVDAEGVFLNIKDDGVGFDTQSVLDSHTGEVCLGLRSMEERVSFLSGQMDIRSEKGKGTDISVVIPLQTGRDMYYEENTGSTC